jgi:hypothetical protein
MLSMGLNHDHGNLAKWCAGQTKINVLYYSLEFLIYSEVVETAYP